MSVWAAEHIANAINNHKENRPFILGLPTETYEDLDGIVDIGRNIEGVEVAIFIREKKDGFQKNI